MNVRKYCWFVLATTLAACNVSSSSAPEDSSSDSVHDSKVDALDSKGETASDSTADTSADTSVPGEDSAIDMSTTETALDTGAVDALDASETVDASLDPPDSSDARDAADVAETLDALDSSGPMHLRVIGVNDFHGQLDPSLSGSVTVYASQSDAGTDAGSWDSGDGGIALSKVYAGGAAYLASAISNARAGWSNSMVLGAGDMIGASQFVSAAYLDQPTLKILDAIGFYASAIGNHELDRGWTELYRLQTGGCPTGGCPGNIPWSGTAMKYISANIYVAGTTTRVFPAYEIANFEGIPVGIVGATIKDIPSLVAATSWAGLEFGDEATAINSAVADLKKQGIRTIIVLVHQGSLNSGYDLNGCKLTDSAIASIVNRLDPEVDWVQSAHSHNLYNCSINTADSNGVAGGGPAIPVTQAFRYGDAISVADFTIDRATKNPTSVVVANQVVTQTGTQDPSVQAIFEQYKTLTAAIGNVVEGQTTGAVSSTQDAAGESPMGMLLADSQLAGTKKYGAVAAFMNPGGVRAAWSCPTTTIDAGTDASTSCSPLNITYSMAFQTQPFSNLIVTLDLTGQQLLDLLEQQFPSTGNKILQVSGIRFSWTATSAGDSGVETGTIDGSARRVFNVTINDGSGNYVPVVATNTYTVATNSFLQGGGDGFTVFKQAANVVSRALDIDLTNAYLGASSTPIPVPSNDRVTKY